MPRGLKDLRQALVDDRDLTGVAWCRRYAEAADAWLADLFRNATRDSTRSVALLAVGGHGRGELAPRSDLDLLLVHDRQDRRRVKELAERLWYPIWDAGVALDYSVRTPKEVRAAMDDDIKVALGLLDGRLIAGDEKLAASVLAKAADQWQTRAARWLPALDDVTRLRHERFGDLAFLLEPDLKEARGGLRDLYLLQSLSKVLPWLADTADTPGTPDAPDTGDLVAARHLLTAARVELHRLSARPTDTLLLQDQDAVAAACHAASADALMADLAGAGRAVAWANDDGWRRVESWLAGPRGRSGTADHPLEPGLVLRDGEVALRADADPRTDASLALRAAAVSAELDRPLARATLDRLAAETAAPEGTWPPEVLHAFVRLLGAGHPAVAAIEALDQCGIWLRYLPEWAPVRNRPQRNAYHRFTVDRHLVETAANAAGLTRSVARPDLLLLGALFHDIGKGHPGDHTEAGIELMQMLAPRLGLDEQDTASLQTLVRHHLLLPDAATRRDLDDPATAATVAAACDARDTLDLLAALTEADSLATGPSAWGTWKAGLVARLVDLAAAILEGRPPPDARRGDLTPEQRALLDAGHLQVLADGGRVTIVAEDQTGLLAAVAGVLTLNGVTVRSATTLSDAASGMALLGFEVAPAFDVLPDWGKVRSDLAAALEGRLALEALLDRREREYAILRRPSAAVPPAVRVTIHNDSSDTATIVEVRAADRGPLLHRVTGALAGAGLTITRALVHTLGAEAVDVFYVHTDDGAKVLDPDRQAALTRAVEEAIGG